MVTKTLELEKTADILKPNLEELGQLLGIPIKVKPWWGSVREYSRRSCKDCGHWVWQEGPERFWCSQCTRSKALELTILAPVKRRWLCPKNQKRIEIESGFITIWEGRCGCLGAYRGPHTHGQRITVKSAASKAILLLIQGTSRVQFLIGMDGATPYAVQVISRLNTVDEAFQWLMPNLVKRAIVEGKEVKRQGDWFFIPTDRQPVVHIHGEDYGARPYTTNRLYRGAFLVYSLAQTRHWASQVCYQSVFSLPCPAPLVKGKVTTPDHPPLHLEDWHIGVRNRSHPWRNTRRTGGLGD